MFNEAETAAWFLWCYSYYYWELRAVLLQRANCITSVDGKAMLMSILSQAMALDRAVGHLN